jgi:hypothetical protein
MKYGESTFDLIYLLYAIVIGIIILLRQKNRTEGMIGSAVLILGIGDAFHLIPRVLNYFVSADFTVWLGFGKLVTSITMTVFYLLLYRIWLRVYEEQENRRTSMTVCVLVAVRIFLCLLPQNRWLQNDSSVLWGVIRNIPFVMLGCVIVYLYYCRREEIRCLRSVWLLVTLSFLFYIPVAVAASLVPMLGMLMLPKTVCYMLLIWCFWKYTRSQGNA